MKPGDTIKRIKNPRSWAPIGFITKCCIDPRDPDPHLIDITKPYGSLGYTALDGSFIFIFQQSDWEVIEGEPPVYFNRIDYSAPDIVVPNVKPDVSRPKEGSIARNLYTGREVILAWGTTSPGSDLELGFYDQTLQSPYRFTPIRLDDWQLMDEITGLPMALMDDVAAIAEAHDEIQDQKDKLYDIVIKWRDENNVWDGEVIALYDHVRENFDDLVFDLIRTVGYAPYKEEED